MLPWCCCAVWSFLNETLHCADKNIMPPKCYIYSWVLIWSWFPFAATTLLWEDFEVRVGTFAHLEEHLKRQTLIFELILKVCLYEPLFCTGAESKVVHPQIVHTQLEAQNCPKSFGKWRHYVFLSLKLRDPGQLQKNTPQRYLSSTKRYSWHSLSGNVLHSPNPDSSIRFVTSQNTFQ